jgi:tetratricopeptide (TPR) repeat protein
MSEVSKAVFLSYASQDAEAARRICEALRGAGLEVWFDADGGLEHGDEWDAKIRRQIKECVLFLPVISANTQAREEGYFRIEWDLAAERARGIASGVPFILPIVIDGTKEPEALVPDRFRAVQWTRLRGGEMTPEVQQRLLKLWSHRIGLAREAAGEAKSADVIHGADAMDAPRRSSRVLLVPVLVGLAALGGVAVWQPWKTPTAVAPAAASPEVADLVRRAWKLVENPGRGRAELEAADDLCKRAAALDPTNVSVLAVWAHVDSWMILCMVDNSAARREAGRTKAMRAVQLAPESFEARLALACFQVRESRSRAPHVVRELEVTLQGLLRVWPGNPHALIALGMLQRFAGQSAAARLTFEELARNPDYAPVAWCEMAYMHFDWREYREAEEALAKVIGSHPHFWNLTMKTWLALYWRGDLELAAATVRQFAPEALREDLGFDVAVWVHILRRDGAAMLRLLEATPRDWIGGPNAGPKAAYTAFAYTFLGRLEAAAVERTAALRQVERRLVESPNSVELLTWKCWLLAEQGEREEAGRISRLLRQLRTSEDGSEMLDRLLMGEFDAAIDVLERVEQKPPGPLWTAAFVRHIWWLDPLRNVPRFQAYQARLDADPRFAPQDSAPSPKGTAAGLKRTGGGR